MPTTMVSTPLRIPLVALLVALLALVASPSWANGNVNVNAVTMANAEADPSVAHQFHLSLVGDSPAGRATYMLDWVTPYTVESGVLRFGTSATALNHAVEAHANGLVEQSGGAIVACWSALLPSLRAGDVIYYALDDNSTGNAAPLSFTVPQEERTWAVFGDLAAPMQGQAAGISLPALREEAKKDKFQGVLNLGDISYELEHANAQNYMEELAPITSRVPMQTTTGNHEYQYAMAPALALQNYHRRFAGLTLGAGVASGSGSNEFFSFNAGRIHFVFLSTEVYGDEAFMTEHGDGQWAADEVSRRATAKSQASWLAYDLAHVDRQQTPYVVVGTHRPPFKTPQGLSSSGNKFAQEIVPLLSQYEVDLYLSGHEHSYLHFEAVQVGEYTLPPVIISGSSGNREYIRKMSEIKLGGYDAPATVIAKYGYGYLTATEDSLEWTWGTTGSNSGEDPEATMWSQAHSVSIPRRQHSAAANEAGVVGSGEPVQPPVDVKTQWVVRVDGAASADGSGSEEEASPTGKAHATEDDALDAPIACDDSSSSTASCGSNAAPGVYGYSMAMTAVMTLLWSVVQ